MTVFKKLPRASHGLNDLPVQSVRERGGDFVVAVDLSSLPGDTCRLNHQTAKTGPRRFRFESVNRAMALQRQFLAKTRAADADVIVRPQVGNISLADFDRMDDLIDLGRRAAVQSVPAILKGLCQEIAKPHVLGTNGNTAASILRQPPAFSK